MNQPKPVVPRPMTPKPETQPGYSEPTTKQASKATTTSLKSAPISLKAWKVDPFRFL